MNNITPSPESRCPARANDLLDCDSEVLVHAASRLHHHREELAVLLHVVELLRLRLCSLLSRTHDALCRRHVRVSKRIHNRDISDESLASNHGIEIRTGALLTLG